MPSGMERCLPEREVVEEKYLKSKGHRESGYECMCERESNRFY